MIQEQNVQHPVKSHRGFFFGVVALHGVTGDRQSGGAHGLRRPSAATGSAGI